MDTGEFVRNLTLGIAATVLLATLMQYASADIVIGAVAGSGAVLGIVRAAL